MSDRTKLPTVRQPRKDLESIHATLLEIKELLEVLAGQRGDGSMRAVTEVDVARIVRQLSGT